MDQTSTRSRLTTLLLIIASMLASMLAAPVMADGLRLVRYGEPGQERAGMLDAQDRIRDLSAVLPDITPETITSLAALRNLDPANLPLVPGNPRLGSPISRAGKIIAVGFNYRDHAEETGTPIPAEPLLFMKAASALWGPFDPILTPRGSTELDYEVELALIIGRRTSYIPESAVMDHIAGFAVGHDVSERAFQTRRGGQFMKGKSADTFAPLGPWLVTPDAIEDVQNLTIFSEVNGQRRQSSSTRHMIFGAARIVSYVSQFMTLYPGDVIYTGTPSGVGSAMQPPQFLKPGDVVRLGIEGLGHQQQTVAPPDQP